jgi:hypothetical protein
LLFGVRYILKCVVQFYIDIKKNCLIMRSSPLLIIGSQTTGVYQYCLSSCKSSYETHNFIMTNLYPRRILKMKRGNHHLYIERGKDNQLSIGEIGLSPPHLLACLKSGIGFPMSRVFLYLRWEVVVCFVDVYWTVDHHCLSFPIIEDMGIRDV